MPDPVPVVLLARLALDRTEQSKARGGRELASRALIVDAIDLRLWRCLADVARAVGEEAAGAPRQRSDDPGVATPALRVSWTVWWQWTTWTRGVMSDIAKTVRPDLVAASVQHLDGLLGPLAAYLDALEARVVALERRSSAVRLMTAADAARYARVNVETILRAIRAGELSVAGYIGRSPRISRDALVGWLATRSPSAPSVAREPRRARGRAASDAVEAAWQALG
jgi:excisionase family DNA binding protein